MTSCSGRSTPSCIRAKAKPPEPDTHFRVRKHKVDQFGKLTLRYQSRLLHLGVGRTHNGTHVMLLVADKDVRVVDREGELIGHFEIEPTRDYQTLCAP